MEFANDGAERLNSYLDAHAQGHAADPDGLDPELVATYEQVKTLHARATPDPTLKANLWRNLMTTPQAAIPFNAPATPATRATTAPRPKADRWRRPQRLMNAFATLALIAAVAGAAYFFNRPPDQPRLNAALIATPGTPVASPQAAACIDANRSLGTSPKSGFILVGPVLQSISPTSLLTSHVQLQGWSVDSGASASVPAVRANQYAGLAMDFVLKGYYSATFNGPAFVVTAGNVSLTGWTQTMVPAGQTVDLAQGDAVMFNYGDGMTVHNVSSVNHLLFKRALFTEQAASAAPPTGAGFTAAVEQTSVLPVPLGSVTGQDGTFILLVAQRLTGSDDMARPVCDNSTAFQILTSMEGAPIATPTASSNDVSGPNGYALWIFQNLP